MSRIAPILSTLAAAAVLGVAGCGAPDAPPAAVDVAPAASSTATTGAPAPAESSSAPAADPAPAPAPATTAPATTPATTTTARTVGDTYTIADVVDGDTLKVNTSAGVKTVRLIGIDTPETKHPNKPVQCFGKEASAEAARLVSGGTVRIITDPTQGAQDRYGRMLGYVQLPDGSDFGERMLTGGFATEYTYDGAYARQGTFRAAAAAAKQAGRGLWSASTCDGDPERPAAGATTKASSTATTKATTKATKSSAGSGTSYASCAEARAAGAAPLHEGDPGYSTKLDRDRDGTACEGN